MDENSREERWVVILKVMSMVRMNVEVKAEEEEEEDTNDEGKMKQRLPRRCVGFLYNPKYDKLERYACAYRAKTISLFASCIVNLVTVSLCATSVSPLPYFSSLRVVWTVTAN